MSGYLDLVEVCLNEQISLQSDSLFSAIRQLQDFQVRVSETLQAIRLLKCSLFGSVIPRNDTTTIANKHTIPPLLVSVYSRRIANLKKVQQLVRVPLPFDLDQPDREDSVHAGPGASSVKRVSFSSSPYVATNTSRATRASKNASRICEVTWEASRL